MNETLLKKRIDEAPRMEPQDAVKLAYQSAFGCGHLITDENACAARLAAEIASIPPAGAVPDGAVSDGAVLDESLPFMPGNEQRAAQAVLIGGGHCRLSLAAPAIRRLSPRRLTAMMRLTAENDALCSTADTKVAFEETLDQLARLAAQGGTPFSLAAFEDYLAAYREAGCPAVHHSDAYRAEYLPAYRVVLTDFAVLLPLIAAIDQRLADRPVSAPPLVCVLDGSCGSGKTTLASRLAALYGGEIIHMDDFFLPPDLRTPERLRESGGNIHYERFEQEVLPFLNQRSAFSYRRFDCQTGRWLPRTCAAAPLRIVEGSYAMHPRFQADYAAMKALTAFLAVEDAAQLSRIARRCPDKLERFRQEWIPLEKSYFRAYDIKEQAQFVLHSLCWEGCP